MIYKLSPIKDKSLLNVLKELEGLTIAQNVLEQRKAALQPILQKKLSDRFGVKEGDTVNFDLSAQQIEVKTKSLKLN